MPVAPINQFNLIRCIVAVGAVCGFVGATFAVIVPQVGVPQTPPGGQAGVVKIATPRVSEGQNEWQTKSLADASSYDSVIDTTTLPNQSQPLHGASTPAVTMQALEKTRQAFASQFDNAYREIVQASAISTQEFEPNQRASSVLNVGSKSDSIVDHVVSSTGQEEPSERLSESGIVRWLGDGNEEDDRAAPSDRIAAAIAPLPRVRPNTNDFQISAMPPLPSATPAGQSFSVTQTDVSEPQLDWWTSLVQQPLHPQNQTQPVDSNWLVYMALQNSPRIQSLSRDPLIRDFEVVEADSVFDPVSFLETQFADRSDPLGGSLDATRDGLDTIENHNWTAGGGIRGRARTGATYELSQRLGFQNSNVAVFDPNNQGTAQLALNVTQPLARGRGRYINQSQLLIAQSRGGAAWDTFTTELQEEIEDVVSSYWRLYYDRSVFLQKKRNVERAAKILETLEGRAGLDSLPSQITRARSSLQTRKTDLANAFRDVRNAETELRRLIADRNWLSSQNIELLPAEPPIDIPLGLSVQHVVTTALNNRPEIRESLRRAKIAGIEKDISENDLLPELSLLLGTYVSTLEGNSRVGDAFTRQFGQTKPGYSVGIEFELPIHNRAARSRLVQRNLQLAKIKNEVDESMQNVIAESQTSLRRLDSASATLAAAKQAIAAAQSDLQQHLRRWESFALIEGDFADGQTPTTVLDQLLDSQERLASAELVAARSQMELKVAEVTLQRTMGTLLMQKQINPQRGFECGEPTVTY